jgi:hypothetical protein
MGTVNDYMDAGVTERVNRAVDRLNQRIARAEAINQAARERLDRERTERDVARRERKTEMQASVDSLYHQWSESPPIPNAEDSPSRYRRRLLRNMQEHLAPGDPSSLTRAPNLSREDNAALDVIEPRVRDAFAKAVRDPQTVPEGQFREIREDDPRTGQRISSFVGRESFVKQMGLPCSYVVGGSAGLRHHAEVNSRRR